MLFSVAQPATVDLLWQGQHVKAVQGQYIAYTLHSDAFGQLAKSKGFTDVHLLGGKGYYQFSTDLSPDQIAKIGKYHTDAISKLQPNTVVTAADSFPSDPLAQQQWQLRNTGQVEPYDYNQDGVVTPYNQVTNPTPPSVIPFPSPPYPNENQVGTPGMDLNTQKAWDITTGSSNVVVAVLDTGIDTSHPDLAPNLFVNPGEVAGDGIDNDNNGFPDDVNGWNFVNDSANVTDDNGHGTHVAGTIGAVGNNSLGVSGVAWNVKLLPVKVLDSTGAGTDAQIIAGINYVTSLKDAGINIVAINESLSGVSFPFDVVENNAVKAAGEAGILDVVAAGNDSSNIDSSFVDPAKFSLNVPTVVTVAATDNQGKLAAFSNFGSASVDLAAPGVNILSTTPTYTVPLNGEIPSDQMPFGLNYGYLSGTSQATPQVTGIIALEASANPSATPEQLKKALLDGVTPDAALGSVNGIAPKVHTGGVANAFNAVKNILDQFVTTDTTRRGNWNGFYGTQGAYVVGESTTFPSFVNGTLSGASPVILQNSTHNVAGLQKVSDPGDRISAYDASASTETITLSFTDGIAHRVGMYVADLDHKHRTELIQIVDTTSGTDQVLDTEEATKFAKGEYFIWDLRGDIQIRITNIGGPSAVFSGLFFDPPPGTPIAFRGVDTTTQGIDWRNQYGSQGQFFAGDDNSNALASYVSGISITGNTGKIVKAKTTDKRALQKLQDVNSGIESYWNTTDHLDINLTMADTQLHTVTLYVADYERLHRTERVQLIDPTTGALLYSQDLFNFTKGAFISFNVSGKALIRVIRTGGPDAVVSGLMFDAPAGEQVHFVNVDTTTQGNWKNAGYGSTYALVAGDNLPGVDVPGSAVLAQTGVVGKSVFAITSANQNLALLRPEDLFTRRRIAADAFTNSDMTFAYNPGDRHTHQIAVYFVDYGKQNRVEALTLSDPTTGAVITRQRIAHFAKGKYFVFNVRGPILITITSQSFPNAVMSGIFTD